MELIYYWLLITTCLAASCASQRLREIQRGKYLSEISKRDESGDALEGFRREIPMKRFIHGDKLGNNLRPEEVRKNFAKARTVSLPPQAISLTKMPYKMDNVLNYFRRRKDDSNTDSYSSSQELGNWKDEWRNVWFGMKLQALNMTDLHGGDKVNMVAARPWGVPCGDPFQHDMPWGSCMLAQECEAEYRIFRGDFKCGATEFICCAVQVTSYDQYEAFDVSFDSTDFETDSWEAKQKSKKKKKNHDKEKRKRDRKKRKKKIKNMIKSIIRKIKAILNKISHQGTKQRKRKTKLLKNFIKYMKKKYKEDRKSVQEIHTDWMKAIDDHTLDLLLKIKQMNIQFQKKNSYGSLLGNGTINYNLVRQLMQQFPEMKKLIENKATELQAKPARRFLKNPPDKPKYLDYDLEYGFLYY